LVQLIGETTAQGQLVQNPRLFDNHRGDVSLGSLGGTNGVANALNNSNQVVGWSQTTSGAQHAFLYSNGTMQDLNLLIPPISGITLTSAVGIDGSGRIVAYGTDSSGQTQEFLLTPAAIPEPSTLAVFGLMIVAFAAHQARSHRS
jgi:probable HAF family extracellular repeat protein